MNVFEKSKWIWINSTQSPDSYAEFRFPLSFRGDGTVMRISCDSDYTLFINGNYVASNQYGDFEHYKIYDTLDLTRNLQNGENTVEILVHYFGVDSQRYKVANAGLIFEIEVGGEVVKVSDTDIPSRLSPTYVSGRQVKVSSQLGFTFKYDSRGKSDSGFFPSRYAEKSCNFFPRPIKKSVLMQPATPESVKKIDDTHYLIDLGKETVGVPLLELISDTEQTVTVGWGEHLTSNGGVPKKIGNRNFNFEYVASVGENRFTSYMLRISGRYLEVFAEKPIKLICATILPQVYEVTEKPVIIEDELDRRIYATCVNTLKLCMMEHYVDTPWREQCLYAFDSRNQMLCGYYAFEHGNADYARSNLVLLSEDRRGDGLLSICSPCGSALTIPSFSLYYILAMREYAEYTNDISLIRTYQAKMEGILNVFLTLIDENGLVRKFSDTEHWNFYDWSEHLEGKLFEADEDTPDLVLNCLFTMALDSFEIMCKKADMTFKYEGVADTLRQRIGDAFLNENGLFSHYGGGDEYTVLGNSLAILCGAVTGSAAGKICDKIVRGDLSSSSLSMNVWKYEALIQTNAKKYKAYVLNEIRANYKYMLERGASTVWETLKGADDFGGSGSLCHGWSAVPIYFYHKLGIAKNI